MRNTNFPAQAVDYAKVEALLVSTLNKKYGLKAFLAVDNKTLYALVINVQINDVSLSEFVGSENAKVLTSNVIRVLQWGTASLTFEVKDV